MNRNDLLSGLTTLDVAINACKPQTREPLTTFNLKHLRKLLSIVVQKLREYKISAITMGHIYSTLQLVDTILNSQCFVETDNAAKTTIVHELTSAFNELSVYACNWYMDNEFDYEPTLSGILNKIIAIGVANNVSFVRR